jgi:rhodanese-related sulfurtransferase
MFLFLWRILGIVSLACLAAVIHRSFIADEAEVVFTREASPKRPSSQALNPATTPNPAKPESTPQVQFVTLIPAEKAHALYEEEAVQFIDARNEDDYNAGHLPLAVHLPLASFASGFPKALDNLIPEVPAIVYCEGGNCESSQLVARQLVAAGFESVMVIEDGYPGWIAGDYPIDSGEEASL